MIKKIFNFKNCIILSCILVIVIIVLVILGMKNFYKHSEKKEMLMQRMVIFLKEDEREYKRP